MPGLPDEGPAEALCPTVPRHGHQGGALLHPPGGPAEWPEEARYHGLQDGSQVGLKTIFSLEDDESGSNCREWCTFSAVVFIYFYISFYL